MVMVQQDIPYHSQGNSFPTEITWEERCLTSSHLTVIQHATSQGSHQGQKDYKQKIHFKLQRKC